MVLFIIPSLMPNFIFCAEFFPSAKNLGIIEYSWLGGRRNNERLRERFLERWKRIEELKRRVRELEEKLREKEGEM